MILEREVTVEVYTDASMKGFGAWWGTDWLGGTWQPDDADGEWGCCHEAAPPQHEYDMFINTLELWPVIQAVARWSDAWRNQRVLIVTDNMQVLYMLRTGRSKNVTCMGWLRELFWRQFLGNFEIQTVYIRSEDNVWADAISRLAYRGMASVLRDSAGDRLCCISRHKTTGVEAEGTGGGRPGGQYLQDQGSTGKSLPAVLQTVPANPLTGKYQTGVPVYCTHVTVSGGLQHTKLPVGAVEASFGKWVRPPITSGVQHQEGSKGGAALASSRAEKGRAATPGGPDRHVQGGGHLQSIRGRLLGSSHTSFPVPSEKVTLHSIPSHLKEGRCDADQVGDGGADHLFKNNPVCAKGGRDSSCESEKLCAVPSILDPHIDVEISCPR